MLLKLPSMKGVDDDRVRFRCACGIERQIARERACPSCGAAKPAEISLDGQTWITFEQFQADRMRELLSPDALE